MNVLVDIVLLHPICRTEVWVYRNADGWIHMTDELYGDEKGTQSALKWCTLDRPRIVRVRRDRSNSDPSTLSELVTRIQKDVENAKTESQLKNVVAWYNKEPGAVDPMKPTSCVVC